MGLWNHLIQKSPPNLCPWWVLELSDTKFGTKSLPTTYRPWNHPIRKSIQNLCPRWGPETTWYVNLSNIFASHQGPGIPLYETYNIICAHNCPGITWPDILKYVIISACMSILSSNRITFSSMDSYIFC